MNTYGCVGVDSDTQRFLQTRHVDGSTTPGNGPAANRKPSERVQLPHASTFHGSQSGATTPGPSNPAGCQLYEAYAREQCADGPPDVITNYADRRGV